MRFTALSVVAFLAGADAFGVSSQQSIRKPAFTSSTAVQGVKNPPANESTPAKALVSRRTSLFDGRWNWRIFLNTLSCGYNTYANWLSVFEWIFSYQVNIYNKNIRNVSLIYLFFTQ